MKIMTTSFGVRLQRGICGDTSCSPHYQHGASSTILNHSCNNCSRILCGIGCTITGRTQFLTRLYVQNTFQPCLASFSLRHALGGDNCSTDVLARSGATFKIRICIVNEDFFPLWRPNWMAKNGRHNWSHFCGANGTLWLLQNDALHGKDAADQHRAEQREIRRRLEQVYDSRSQMEPSVQELLCLDIQTHLQRPTWVNKNWLSIHTPLVQASIRRVRVKAIQGVRSIRTYFGPR